MIIDVFPYRDESEILEIRMAELGRVVGRHLLIQSRFTFTGQPKAIREENGEKLTVRTMPDSLMLTTDDAWERESRTCEFAMDRGRELMKPGDYLLVGDVDEIPDSHSLLYNCTWQRPLAFELRTFRCWLDHEAPKQRGWRPVLVPYDWAQKLTWAQIRKPDDEWDKVSEAGWHFTDMGGRDKQIAKLKATSHANDPPVREALAELGSNLAERYHREGLLEQVPLTQLPRYVQDNMPRMRELGLLEPESTPCCSKSPSDS